MEILLGVILLLQLVILIQIMHSGNLWLQRLERLEKIIDEKIEWKERMQTTETVGCVMGDLQPEQQVPQENQTIEKREKVSQEALLNEVLSEVFS